MLLVENLNVDVLHAAILLPSGAGNGSGNGAPPTATAAAAPSPGDDREQFAADAVDKALTTDMDTVRLMRRILKQYRRVVLPWGLVYRRRE